MNMKYEESGIMTSNPLNRKLSRDEINDLDINSYDGPIELVRSDKDMRESVKALKSEKLLGFDTETRPAFKKGVSYPTSLLQLASSNCVYVFQLQFINDLETLFSLLADENIIKAGVSVSDDVKDLRKLSEFEAAGFSDIGDAARRHGIPHHGLRGLTALLMGFRITKSGQKYNWSLPRLRRSAVVYAATDAWVGRELHMIMEKRNCI